MLANVRCLRDYFNAESEALSNSGDVVKEFTDLVRHIWRGTGSSSTLSLKKLIGKDRERFKGYSQEDVVDFIQSLLNDLEEELLEEVSYKGGQETVFGSNFICITSKTYSCSGCVTNHVINETYNILPLIVGDHGKKDCSLEWCLRSFLESYQVDKYCEKCKGDVSSAVETEFILLPEVFMMQLNRFVTDLLKIETYVQYPLQFTCSSSSLGQMEYRLSSVVNHYGTLKSGHYTCCVRRGSQWYLADDESVTAVSSDAVQTRNAYILLYERMQPENIGNAEEEEEKDDVSGDADSVKEGPEVSKFLDSAGSRLDYRRYAEPLLDVLFAEGILAPGGSVVRDAGTERTSVYENSIFKTKDDTASLKDKYEMLSAFIQREKYLEKSFEKQLKKLILFLKRFSEPERAKLAKVVGICLANGLGGPSCLVPLFEDHLVNEGLSLEFAQSMFKAWLQEKDMQNVATALKKAGIEGKLLELLPINKRTQENFENLFLAAGLEQVVEYQRVKAKAERKKGIKSKLEDMIHNEEPVKEMISLVKDHMARTNMQEHEMVVMIWNMLMNAVEWNKKEELVADQALKHLKQYTSLLAALTENGRSELALIIKMQEYCYDNMNFLKVFQKIVVLFYKADVLGEDSILKWYQNIKLTRSTSTVLQNMECFIKFLEGLKD